MIELRWKKIAINPATAKAQGIDYAPDNWVIIEDEDYAVMQYRTFKYMILDGCFAPDSDKPMTIEWSEWKDVGIVGTGE